MIKINGKEMSKALHYDACIETWNEIAEKISDKICGTDVKCCIFLINKYVPFGSCFACEAHIRSCQECPFEIEYKQYCLKNGPFREFSDGRGTRQDAIEIAQLFIDYYPETDEELTYRDF